MVLPDTTPFLPDDGTPVGRALGDLNALLAVAAATPGAAVVRVATFFVPSTAYVDLLDASGAPLAPGPDLVALEGAPPAATIAEFVAASLIAEGDPAP